MAWTEINITTTKEHAHAIGDVLNEFGAQAVTMHDAGDQPIYEPALDATPLWPETIVVGLFEQEHPITNLITQLENLQSLQLLKNLQIKHLADEDWERRCLDDLEPMLFGKRLWICPSWKTIPDPEAVNIILDPGLAFGTGTHPTTALCLEWLDGNLKAGSTVIDYGCGSGILALAALKLGAKSVIGVDHDPQALIATHDNAQRNNIPSEQLETHLPEDEPQIQCDLMMANILAQPLIDMAEKLSQFVKPGGNLLLSGILAAQADRVIAAYTPYFEMQNPAVKGDWVRLVGKKHA